MKKHRYLVVTCLCVLLLAVVLMPVMPVSADTVVKSNEHSDQITLTGNCELRLTFDVVEGDGYLEIDIYDADATQTNDVETNAPNYVRLKSNGCIRISGNTKWHNKIESVSFDNHIMSSELSTGTGYELVLNRWDNRIAVKITGPDGAKHWDMVYNAQTDMANTIYFRLYPQYMSLGNLKHTMGESDSILDVVCWTIELFLCVSLTGVIVLFGLNFLFSRIEDDFFFYTNFNFVTGGLWGFAVLTALGLAIPGTRELYCTLLGSIIGLHSIPLYEIGWLMWIIVVLCAVAAIGYLVEVVKNAGENPVVATLLMILFGIVHALSWYFIIGVTVRMILGGIVLAIVLLVLTGCTKNSRSVGGNAAEPSASQLPKYLRMDGDLYCVFDGGEDYLYVYRHNHQSGDAFRIQKFSVDEDFYVDEKGNSYYPSND